MFGLDGMESSLFSVWLEEKKGWINDRFNTVRCSYWWTHLPYMDPPIIFYFLLFSFIFNPTLSSRLSSPIERHRSSLHHRPGPGLLRPTPAAQAQTLTILGAPLPPRPILNRQGPVGAESDDGRGRCAQQEAARQHDRSWWDGSLDVVALAWRPHPYLRCSNGSPARAVPELVVAINKPELSLASSSCSHGNEAEKEDGIEEGRLCRHDLDGRGRPTSRANIYCLGSTRLCHPQAKHLEKRDHPVPSPIDPASKHMLCA